MKSPFRFAGLGFAVALTIAALALPTSAWAERAVAVKQVRVLQGQEALSILLDLSDAPQSLQVSGQSPNARQLNIQFSGYAEKAALRTGKRPIAHANANLLFWSMPSRSTFHLSVQRRLGVEPSVSVDPKARRLVIRIPNRLPETGQEIHPGLRWSNLTYPGGNGTVMVHVLTLNPRMPSLEVVPVLPGNTMRGLAPTRTIVTQNAAIAGINASFFKPDSKIPLGLLMIDGEMVTGPLFNRTVLGIGRDQSLHMERVEMRGEVLMTGNQRDWLRLGVDTVNQPRVYAGQTILYSPWWGRSAPPVPKNGVQIQIANHQITAISNQQALPIPAEGYVLSIAAGKASGLSPKLLGARADVRLGLSPDWKEMKHAIAGGPYLVRNGVPYVDAAAQRFRFGTGEMRAPRTAVGIREDGQLLLVACEGLRGRQSGLSLWEMAKLMKSLGAVQAMNFDGGSSTQMVMNGRQVTRTAGLLGRPVSASLLVRPVVTSYSGLTGEPRILTPWRISQF